MPVDTRRARRVSIHRAFRACVKVIDLRRIEQMKDQSEVLRGPGAVYEVEGHVQQRHGLRAIRVHTCS